MGLNANHFKTLETIVDWNGLSVCEFGDQIIDPAGIPEFAHYQNIPSRQWYLEHGVAKYVSIDLNGQHGSLVRDIRGDLSDLGQFDVVTNFGTLEHVIGGRLGQLYGLSNMHRLCKVNGLMIHDVPVDQAMYRGHAPVLYTERFLRETYASEHFQCLYLAPQLMNGCQLGCFRKLDNRPFVFRHEAMDELRFFPGEGKSGRF